MIDVDAFKRELEILTTTAGWSWDDAIEFLNKSAKAGGGETLIPISKITLPGREPASRRLPLIAQQRR